MALVREAGLESRFDGCRACAQQALCEEYPALDQVSMRSHSDLTRKSPQKLKATHTGKCGQFG